jgi:hypothetical protein
MSMTVFLAETKTLSKIQVKNPHANNRPQGVPSKNNNLVKSENNILSFFIKHKIEVESHFEKSASF